MALSKKGVGKRSDGLHQPRLAPPSLPIHRWLRRPRRWSRPCRLLRLSRPPRRPPRLHDPPLRVQVRSRQPLTRCAGRGRRHIAGHSGASASKFLRPRTQCSQWCLLNLMPTSSRRTWNSCSFAPLRRRRRPLGKRRLRRPPSPTTSLRSSSRTSRTHDESAVAGAAQSSRARLAATNAGTFFATGARRRL